MPGLDRNIVEHRLPLLPGSIPVRQQLRRMKSDMALKINEEVEKQWEAGFLAVSNYPQWVANIVPVPKKDGKLRPLPTGTPNIQSLRCWGGQLKGQWQRAFERKYENLLGLVSVEVQPTAFSTLSQYYDPPLRCFTFRDFQLAPTLEEYERLIRIPYDKSPPYLFVGHYPS
ncbi:hypothetical protein CR513_24631, partial [Mucuna pruriens]